MREGQGLCGCECVTLTDSLTDSRLHCLSAGLRLDDLVATPVGAGYLRGYRREDGVCIVVYPWGHGFVQLSHVACLEQAIAAERQKRKRGNEFLVLERQHLYEDVESLLDNYPPASASASANVVTLTPEGVRIDEYEQLIAALQEEEVRACVRPLCLSGWMDGSFSSPYVTLRWLLAAV